MRKPSVWRQTNGHSSATCAGLELDREIRTTELDDARAEVRAAAADLKALDQQVATLTSESNAALPDLRARLVTLYKLGRGQDA